MLVFGGIATAIACGVVLSTGRVDSSPVKITLLSITNDATSGSTRGVFELDNGLKTPVMISTALVERNSGWHWALLCHSTIERLDRSSSSIIFPTGRTIFQAWLPDRGGPYRLVLPSRPLTPWRDSWRQRFAFFASYHNLMPGWAYKARWQLEGHPALISSPFRMSDGRPVKKEDFPVVSLSSHN